jgi:hypothetical protein
MPDSSSGSSNSPRFFAALSFAGFAAPPDFNCMGELLAEQFVSAAALLLVDCALFFGS